MSIVFLDYTFLFDPKDTWQHLFQFEQAFGKYLDAIGLEAQVMKSVEGQQGRRILLIKKKQNLVVEPAGKPGRPKGYGSQLKEMAHRDLRAPAKEFLRHK